MPQLIIDEMDNAGDWKAVGPDGATASTELNMINDTLQYRFGLDKTSAKISASTAALNHSLRRALPNLNLNEQDEIRFWLNANRAADGTAARPYYLEMRLASATMSLGDAGNTWRRFLPVANPGSWDLVRLRLDDLPAAVRGAANLLALRVADASTPFSCFIDDVLGVREEMIGDVDAALLALLDKQFSSNGSLVPAFFTLPENPPNAVIPSIRITQYDLQYDREHTMFTQQRGDFSPQRFRLSPFSIYYIIFYMIDVYGSTRQQKTQIEEFVLRVLSPRSELVINGALQLLEWVTIEPLDDTGKWRTDRQLLYFQVAARQEVGSFEAVVPPFAAISLVTDQQAALP